MIGVCEYTYPHRFLFVLIRERGGHYLCHCPLQILSENQGKSHDKEDRRRPGWASVELGIDRKGVEEGEEKGSKRRGLRDIN